MTEKQIDLLIERLTRRIDKANTYFLKEISKSLKEIRGLTPSQAHQLVQILKYDGNYEKILNKIQKYTALNLEDIDKIFKEYAKKDQQFSKKFYEYRNKPFIKYDENPKLKKQVDAITNIARNDMFNFSRTNVIGYVSTDLKGKVKFTGLRETYNRVLDDALLNVGQGKETFDSAMGKILNELGMSGLRTLQYESGRKIRLDSAVRMHLKSRLRELHNEMQEQIGKDIDADGVEITVHDNPAPDHEEVQGRQFEHNPEDIKKGIKTEWEKLQDGEYAKDYNGNVYTLDHDHKNGYRPISEMNCYHTIQSIVLGVSKPRYTDKELQDIIDRNEKGFELDGKHYTMYEGTQLQRSIEREIRKQKDIHIMARESNNQELLAKSQKKIDALMKKYKEVNKVSGLNPMIDRMQVSGFHRVKLGDEVVNKPKIISPKHTPDKRH